MELRIAVGYIAIVFLLLNSNPPLVTCSFPTDFEAVYGESCNGTIQCKLEDGLQCSSATNICECKMTGSWNSTFEIMEFDSGRRKCVAQLDSFCFYKKPIIGLGFSLVEMDCIEHAHCDSVLEKCICESGYHPKNKSCILSKNYGESCSEDETSCKAINSLECDKTDSVCRCHISNYNEHKNKCVMKAGGFDCRKYDIECTENSHCTYYTYNYNYIYWGRCLCDNGFYEEDEMCFKKKLHGESCYGYNMCMDEFQCIDGKCQCRYGYIEETEKCHYSKYLGNRRECKDGCDSDSYCIKSTGLCSDCYSRKYYQVGNNCLARGSVGDACNDTEYECSTNLYCRNKVCQCEDDEAFESTTGYCITGLGQFCASPFGRQNSTRKQCPENALCDKGYCRCQLGLEKLGTCEYSPTDCDREISIYSYKDSQCVGLPQKSCIGNKCWENAVCTEGICICDPEAFYENPVTHECHFKRIYQEKCKETYQCIQNEHFDLECRRGVCNCKEDFKYVEVKKYEYNALTTLKSGRIYSISGDFVGPRVYLCAPKIGKTCKGYCKDNAVCGAKIVPSLNGFEYTDCRCDMGHIHYSGSCQINTGYRG